MHRLLIIATVSLLVGGCRTGIEMTTEILPDGGSTQQYAGNAGKTNHVTATVRPPLKQVWHTELSGPSGSHAAFSSGKSIIIPTLLEGLDIIDAATGVETGYVTTEAAILGTAATSGTTLFIPITGGPLALRAIDITTGKQQWYATGEPVENPLLILGDRIITTGMFGTVSCYAMADSNVIWKKKLPEPILCGASGTDSLVFVGCANGDVYAFSLSVGDTVWRFSSGDAIHASPVTNGTMVYTVNRSGRLVALNASDGELVWETQLETPLFSAPALGSTYLVVAGPDGIIRAYDALTGNALWSVDLEAVPSGTPLLTAGYIIASCMNGRLVALERSTGNLVWEDTIEGRIRTSPLYGNGIIVFITDTGDIYGYAESAD